MQTVSKHDAPIRILNLPTTYKQEKTNTKNKIINKQKKRKKLQKKLKFKKWHKKNKDKHLTSILELKF